MNRDKSTARKRRLESEVSQASGITCSSNNTQTTELSSDLEDNNSDSSSVASQIEVLYDRRPSATNDPTIKQINNPRAKRAKRQFVRKRQVSLSLGEDDDETFKNDTRDKDYNSIQHWEPLTYDNKFSGKNDSRSKVRPENSLDTNVISFNKSQSPFSGVGEQQINFQPTMRSNTASQIHGHEHEIQRKLDLTPLRNDTLYSQFNSHLYESLQSLNTAQNITINDRPVETVVSMTSNDSDYLHPVTETKVQGNNFVNSGNTSGFSGDRCSAYAHVMQQNEDSTRSQRQKKSYYFCDNFFYRRGFYILLVFNVIIVLLNSCGLPLIYFAVNVKPEEIGSEEDETSAFRSDICFDVSNIHGKVKKELCGDFNIDDGKCCFESAEKMLPRFLGIFDELVRAPPTEKSANTPAIQVKADSKRNNNHQSKIVWESRAEINTLEAKKTDTTIKVPKTGYYYVYSRVHYKKTSDKDKGKLNGFTIGHTIMKTEKEGEGKFLDKVVQRCFPSNTTGDIIHTNQLGSLHHLQEGDSLYVKLDHRQYFVYEDTLFGMFMVAT